MIGLEVVSREGIRGAACDEGVVIVRWREIGEGLKNCCGSIGAVRGTGVTVDGEAVVGPGRGRRRWLNNGGSFEGGW